MISSKKMETLKKTAFENLLSFYQDINKKLDDTTDIVKSKFVSLKLWINESITNCPIYISEKFALSKIFIYNRIINPSKNLMILKTDECITFLITGMHNTKAALGEITNFFSEQAEIFFHDFEEKTNAKNTFIKFSCSDEVNYVKIDIDNSVLMINPKKFKEKADQIYQQMAMQTFEFFEQSKNYLRKKYSLFLGDERIEKEQ